MSAVNNATGVYATLGYSYSDPNNNIQTFDANTQNNLIQFPAVIQSWQAQDIATNSVGGYFQNPVVTYVNTIITIALEIFNLANSVSGNANSSYTGTANLATLVPIANSLITDAYSFLAHTNRVSGVTPITGQTDISINPYYQTAVAYGKQAIIITNQTDGITNNSPILGSMTSILIGPQISQSTNTLTNDWITLNSGVTNNTLSNAQVVQITTDLTQTDTLLINQQSNDVTFFQNVENLVNNYNNLQQFSNMGDTETYLCNNLVGTPKLISRINS